MTRILEVVKTYEPRGEGMAHTGYFIVSNNYPLKWVEAWRWDDMASRPLLRLCPDRVLQWLTNAA